MLHVLASLAVTLVTVLGMELFAWAAHRWVMHGWGWGWHRSHHEPRTGWFEKNDLYAIVFAGVAIALIALGTSGVWPLQWIGAGMTLYGALYFVVARRPGAPALAAGSGCRAGLRSSGCTRRTGCTMRCDGREGCVSFGFLWAPQPQRAAPAAAGRRSATLAVPGLPGERA